MCINSLMIELEFSFHANEEILHKIYTFMIDYHLLMYDLFIFWAI